MVRLHFKSLASCGNTMIEITQARLIITELQTAVASFGFNLSPRFYNTLMRKFDRTGSKTITFDDFIQCCVLIQTLSAAFQRKDTARTGRITITYEEFMDLIYGIDIFDMSCEKIPWEELDNYKDYNVTTVPIMAAADHLGQVSSLCLVRPAFPAPRLNKTSSPPISRLIITNTFYSHIGSSICEVKILKFHTPPPIPMYAMPIIYIICRPVRMPMIGICCAERTAVETPDSASERVRWLPTALTLVPKPDGNGQITFQEFGQLWKYINDWQSTFRYYDRDNSGSIDQTELQTAVASFGFNLSPRFYNTLMRKFDRTGSKTITFDDFIQRCQLPSNEKTRQGQDGLQLHTRNSWTWYFLQKFRTLEVRIMIIRYGIDFVRVNYITISTMSCEKIPWEELDNYKDYNVTTVPIMAAADHLGQACKDANDRYMLCRTDSGGDPRQCLREGQVVTNCTKLFMDQVYEKCKMPLARHATCIDLSGRKMQSEYKVHHLTSQLLSALGSDLPPESFAEDLFRQSSSNFIVSQMYLFYYPFLDSIQSDPIYRAPDLPEPRFTGRVNFPQSRKFKLYHPGIPGTPIYRAKPFPPSIPVNRGPTVLEPN
eukprot:sb/3463208/